MVKFVKILSTEMLKELVKDEFVKVYAKHELYGSMEYDVKYDTVTNLWSVISPTYSITDINIDALDSKTPIVQIVNLRIAEIKINTNV